MVKPKRNRPSDLNQAAHSIISDVISLTENPQKPVKNPAAVSLGRLGGLKGGRARAEKLSNEERSNIARNAAISRWKRRSM
jgi:hypothetical protein